MTALQAVFRQALIPYPYPAGEFILRVAEGLNFASNAAGRLCQHTGSMYRVLKSLLIALQYSNNARPGEIDRG